MAETMTEPLVDSVSENVEEGGKAGENEDADAVFNRMEMLHLSLVFVFASATLLLCFIFYYLLGKGYDVQLGIANATGLVSCVAWLHGFIMLIHWNVALGKMLGQLPVLGLLSAVLKTIASVLFNIQPLTGLISNNFGCSWSNLAGICFFHTGNIISVYDMMRNLFNYKKPFCRANLPTYGMWCYLVATTSLVIANALMYMNLYVDSITVPAFAADVVLPVTQMVGGSMLFIGSVIYVIWSA